MLNQILPPPEPLDRKAVGRRIQTARLKRGLRQRDLAAMLGVKKNTIAIWEGGHRLPFGAGRLVALASALHRSIDWILTGRNRRRPVD